MAEIAPSILERGIKLRALTSSPNPHEADSARRRLYEFLGKHGLTEADLVEEGSEAAELGPGLEGNQRIELSRQVAKSRGVKPRARGGDGVIVFVGFPDAARDARQLFYALVGIVEGQCEVPSYSAWRSANDRLAWRTCFWLGFVAVVQQQLDPEHGRVPSEAMAKIVDRALDNGPGLIRRVANGLMAEHTVQEADHIRRSAYEAGERLGRAVPVPAYRGRR